MTTNRQTAATKRKLLAESSPYQFDNPQFTAAIEAAAAATIAEGEEKQRLYQEKMAAAGPHDSPPAFLPN